MLTAAWAPLAAVVVLHVLMGRRRAEARRGRDGELIVEYGPAWRAVAILVAAIWTGLFVFLAISDPPKPDDMPAVFGLIAIATATVAPFAMTVYGASVHSDRGLRKRSPWSKNFDVAWAGVRRVSSDKRWNRIVFETDAGTIRVSNYMNGIADLTAALQQHVPVERRRA
jgi:hypothetical protein